MTLHSHVTSCPSPVISTANEIFLPLPTAFVATSTTNQSCRRRKGGITNARHPPRIRTFETGLLLMTAGNSYPDHVTISVHERVSLKLARIWIVNKNETSKKSLEGGREGGSRLSAKKTWNNAGHTFEEVKQGFELVSDPDGGGEEERVHFRYYPTIRENRGFERARLGNPQRGDGTRQVHSDLTNALCRSFPE
ncbi:hypothetical protein CEXT_35691 [Caerostris extrusa]|uniref:Uncharacterized protein n=1 Tax=Caerostris extrusa TaxID=172846 RepID=A0AAV4NZ35_CAEEX|nr:hypothetical protein CEXT_35691 [Caerostris extrusa]